MKVKHKLASNHLGLKLAINTRHTMITFALVTTLTFSSVTSSALTPARIIKSDPTSQARPSNDLSIATPACPKTFDGIYEWPSTPANRTVSMLCTIIFANAMSSKGIKVEEDDFQDYFARKVCLADGHWASDNWTNYTECLTLLALQERTSSATNHIQDIISYLVLILLIVSLVSLIIAIAIFTIFKPLQCLRIRIHKNLCLALLVNCCLYILMNSLVGIHKLDLASMNDSFCKTLKVLNVYTSMATVNWMFVEGFIFHRRLYAPFHQDTSIFTIVYYAIGWGLPAVCVGSWGLVLEFNSIVSDKSCWEGYRRSRSIFIVSLPMISAVCINFIFLINIIRILMVKLRADRLSDHTTIKAIKATALLIPLLGIHHIVVFYNPSTFNRKLANIYIIINVLFQSIQGIIVAVLYCFTNHEVRAVLNSAWSRRRLSQTNNMNNNMNNNNNNSNSIPNRRSSTPAFIHQASKVSQPEDNKESIKAKKSFKNLTKQSPVVVELNNNQSNREEMKLAGWRAFGRVLQLLVMLKPKTKNELVTGAGNRSQPAERDDLLGSVTQENKMMQTIV